MQNKKRVLYPIATIFHEYTNATIDDDSFITYWAHKSNPNCYAIDVIYNKKEFIITFEKNNSDLIFRYVGYDSYNNFIDFSVSVNDEELTKEEREAIILMYESIKHRIISKM